MNEIIKLLRNQHNYSQQSVAKYLGISRQMYIRYENGDVKPSVETVIALSDLYKVSTDSILKNSTYQKKDFTYENHENALEVSESTVSYGVSSIDRVLQLIQTLRFSEQITLMSKLANIIENNSKQSTLPTKGTQKIPDLYYRKLYDSENISKIQESSIKTIYESLKDDEW